MNEHEDVVAHPPALGPKPVACHRLKVVAAFAVGLLAGTTGLASAGALPDGAQEAAHHAFGVVGVTVPHGDRYQGPECGGPVKNHGQYVRSQPKGQRAQAAASRCGKPLQAGQDDGSESSGGDGATPGAGCQGPPPWAGKGKPDKAAKDARKKACGDADSDEDEGKTPATPGPNSSNGGAPGPAAVTPEPPATEPTVTTLAPTTTTTTSPTSSSTTTATSSTTSSSTTTTTAAPGGGPTPPTTVTVPGEPTTTGTPAASGPAS